MQSTVKAHAVNSEGSCSQAAKADSEGEKSMPEVQAELLSHYMNGRLSKEKKITSGLASSFSLPAYKIRLVHQPIKLVSSFSFSCYKVDEFISFVKLCKYCAGSKPGRHACISLL